MRSRGGGWDPPRVMLVISSLGAGGAERVMSTMANYWAERGWDISLVTLDGVSTDFYPLDPRVTRIGLSATAVSRSVHDAWRNNARRIRQLRRAIMEITPHVVICFTFPTTILALIAGRAAGIPVIVGERSVPTQLAFSRVWNGLRRATYRMAASVVVQTPEVGEWIGEFVPRENVRVIPNPVAPPGDARVPRRERGSMVVAMGRLGPEKAFDDLIRAFARSRAEDWSLVILGEGEERDHLVAVARELGVESAVRLPDRVHEPTAVLRSADVFVMSSRFEGFPNSLLEAMAVGLAVIATDCPFGPRHIIRHDIDGLLVPPGDVDALASAMADLMTNDARRHALSNRAVEVLDRFSLDTVMADWCRLIGDVLWPSPDPSTFAVAEAERFHV